MQVTANFGSNAIPASTAGADLIKDTTMAGFRADVIAESAKQPVMVDFWAPWCEPCKQLTPALERQVQAAKGRVKLVKMNIEEHPQIASQLGVQSIPAIVAFHKGKPVDGFMGALPESEIKTFIDRIAGPDAQDPLKLALGEAALLEKAQDTTGAAQIYAAVLDAEPENAQALAGLARLYIGMDELEQARGLLASIPTEAEKNADIISVRAKLELAVQAAKLGDLDALAAAVSADPTNHQARFDLAIALNAYDRREEAADELVAMIRKDRKWNEEAARKQLLQFFEAWGMSDDATVYGRRQLSAVLFS